MFKFYLDNTLVNDPENWKDFEETLEYDIENNTYLFSYAINLKFNGGDAYQYIVSQYDVNSCDVIELKVEQNIFGNYEQIFVGNIFLSDITINRIKCNVECPVQESGFTSFLNNNKNIVVQLAEDITGIKSKNGVSLTNQLNIQWANVVLFNPSTGVTNFSSSVKGYYIYDCFKFLIAYLSDLQIGFESNFLDRNQSFTTQATNVKRLVLTDGESIYLGSQNISNTAAYCSISLQELLQEVNRFYPIGYYVKKNASGNPVFCIEDLDFFLQNTTSITYSKVNSVFEKRANEVYYSNIQIGGNSVNYDAGIHSFFPEPMYSFGEENYYFNQQCNIDKTKRLTGNYYVDSNIIEELAYTNASNAYATYKENLFFIEVTNTPGAGVQDVAYKTLNSNNANYHYNEHLINSKVISRFDNFGDIYYNDVNNVYTLINSSPKLYLKKLNFEKSISDSDYKLIKSNLFSKIGININISGDIGYGWIKRIERKFSTGESQIELRLS